MQVWLLVIQGNISSNDLPDLIDHIFQTIRQSAG